VAEAGTYRGSAFVTTDAIASKLAPTEECVSICRSELARDGG